MLQYTLHTTHTLSTGDSAYFDIVAHNAHVYENDFWESNLWATYLIRSYLTWGKTFLLLILEKMGQLIDVNPFG